MEKAKKKLCGPMFVFLFNFFYVPVLSNYSRFSAYRINVNRIAHSVHSEKNNQKC